MLGSVGRGRCAVRNHTARQRSAHQPRIYPERRPGTPAMSKVGKRQKEVREVLSHLRARETALMQSLATRANQLDQIEDAAHGVLRADPPAVSDDTSDVPEAVMARLRQRAELRAAEWSAALGSGRVTMSAPLPIVPSAVDSDVPLCACRREAWVVQLQTRVRRVNVAAACLSALPPDGTTRRFIDVTWLDHASGVRDEEGTAGAPGSSGIPRLTALLASVSAPAEAYEMKSLVRGRTLALTRQFSPRLLPAPAPTTRPPTLPRCRCSPMRLRV